MCFGVLNKGSSGYLNKDLIEWKVSVLSIESFAHNLYAVDCRIADFDFSIYGTLEM